MNRQPCIGGRDGIASLFLICIGFAVFLVCVAPAAAQDKGSDYVLGPGDLIKVQVYGEEDLSIEVRLEQDGYISYPLLGEIKVEGVSVSELQENIRSGLAGDYLVEPDVRVYVLEYRLIYVNGEVRKPGGYSYQPGLTVQKAVALAGGFTDLASKNSIYIVPEEGGSRRNADINAQVDPGDTVIVEEGFF